MVSVAEAEFEVVTYFEAHVSYGLDVRRFEIPLCFITLSSITIERN